MTIIKSYKEGSTLVFERSDGQIGIYDFKDLSLYKIRNGVKRKIQSLHTFFSNTSLKDLLNTFTDEKYRKFLHEISRKEYRCFRIGTYLERLNLYLYLEQYILLDLRYTQTILKPLSWYPKEVIKIFTRNQYVFSDHSEYAYDNYPKLFVLILRHMDSINLEHRISDELIRNIDKLHTLINEYGYNYKALIDYIVYLLNHEAYTIWYAVNDLRDYASMQSKMSRNGKYKRYPKYLKSIHDIVSANYRTFKQEHNEELFVKAVNHNLEHSGSTYVTITPKNTNDVKHEGTELSHCVASYIDRIINGTTQILFVRTKHALDNPLLTIEVRNNTINQVKGLYNRDPNKDEISYLNRYAKVKGLKLSERY
jgi:hypothetical protein